jgi:hypothetical protein
MWLGRLGMRRGCRASTEGRIGLELGLLAAGGVVTRKGRRHPEGAAGARVTGGAGTGWGWRASGGGPGEKIGLGGAVVDAGLG